MSNVIQCDHISKTFETADGPFQVIRDISIQAEENEILVLFGPGRCGKTTLLKVIAGLESATAGTIRIKGAEKTVPWLTTMGNVEYGPRMRGVPRKQRRERAQHYIDLVGLSGFEKSFPIQLSGGMRQRVGIARVYCNEPEVMLMDEPFGHLDAQTRYLMQQELERIWETEKRTIVFVTNNIEEALYLADRILVMTNCPATIKQEFKISLPRPRDYTDPEFLRLRREITSIVDPAE